MELKKCLYGRGQIRAAHHRNISSEKFAPLWSNVFTFFGHITLKLGKLPYLKAIFSSVDGYSLTATIQQHKLYFHLNLRVAL